jgi:hypothetical protein
MTNHHCAVMLEYYLLSFNALERQERLVSQNRRFRGDCDALGYTHRKSHIGSEGEAADLPLRLAYGD